jgi:hypothetical protein
MTRLRVEGRVDGVEEAQPFAEPAEDAHLRRPAGDPRRLEHAPEADVWRSDVWIQPSVVASALPIRMEPAPVPRASKDTGQEALVPVVGGQEPATP